MENFNLQSFIDAAEELARADELIRAFNLLDNLPGYYRDHVPTPVLNLKRNILAKIQTTNDLVTSAAWETSREQKMSMKETLRGILILKEVKALNEKGLIPYIIDFGPGDFWMPEVLLDENLKFNYEPICINIATNSKRNQYARIPGEGPRIFFACEIIEHLWDERELVAQSLKGGLPDVIHISTPMYTYDTGIPHWRNIGDLGHLRTYTPRELHSFLAQHYPDFQIDLYNNRIMHARLIGTNSSFREHLGRITV